MPITRSVSTNIWTHPGIADLPPHAKLVYLFLFVNPDSDKCGCVKLSERLACSTLCLTPGEWRGALDDLSLIVRRIGPVYAIRSWIEHACTSDSWKVAALKALENHPPEVRAWVRSETPLPPHPPQRGISSSSSSSSSKAVALEKAEAVATAKEAKAKTTHAHACDPPPLLKPEKKKGKSPSRKIVLSPVDILKGEQVEQLFETWKAIYWGDQSTVRLTPGRDQVLRYHLEHYGFEDTLKAVVGLSFDRWLSERMKEGDRHHIQLPHMLRNDERIDEGVALFNANKVQAAPLMPVDYLLEKVADWRHLSQWKILDRLIGMEATIDHYPEPGDSPARYRGFALEILQAHYTGGLNGKAKDVRTRWTGAGLPQPPQSMEETAESLVELMGRLGS